MYYNKTTGVEYVEKSFRIRSDLASRLDGYSISTGVTRTFIVEHAISEYLDRKENPAEQVLLPIARP